jgi:hypothetical protein
VHEPALHRADDLVDVIGGARGLALLAGLVSLTNWRRFRRRPGRGRASGIARSGRLDREPGQFGGAGRAGRGGGGAIRSAGRAIWGGAVWREGRVRELPRALGCWQAGTPGTRGRLFPY